MSNDVLVLTIPLRPIVRERVKGTWTERPARYPSANRPVVGSHAFGRKSPDYRALADDVEDAARVAVEAGWTPIAYPCRVSITRYIPDARVFDPMNLGQAEANALTRAGVWTDDSLARPIQLDVQSNADGPDRVVIVIQRLAPVPGTLPRAARPVQQRRSRGMQPASHLTAPPKVSPHSDEHIYTGGDIPPGYAVVNARLIPQAEALAAFERHRQRKH